MVCKQALGSQGSSICFAGREIEWDTADYAVWADNSAFATLKSQTGSRKLTGFLVDKRVFFCTCFVLKGIKHEYAYIAEICCICVFFFCPDIHFKKYIKFTAVRFSNTSFKEMYFFLKLTLLLILCCMSVLLSPVWCDFHCL